MVVKGEKKSRELTQNISLNETKIRRKRKNKYIPNLAEFYFKPDDDWTINEANELFKSNKNEICEKIFYEDCIKGMDKLSNELVDLVIADPPFGLSFSGKEAIYNRDPSFVEQGYGEIDAKDYDDFTLKWISKLPRIMKETASAFIFSGWTNLLSVLEAIKNANLIIKNHLIWNYNFAVFTKKKFSSSHYHLLYVVKNEKKAYFNRINHYETDVWDIKRKYKPNQNKNGTKLPTELVRKCINYVTTPGDLVFDPFFGNGTSGVAAKGEFRHYLGFEINYNMKKIIDSNLFEVKTGEYYKSYQERLPTIDELAKIYPKAYKEYLKREKIN
ncbi:MAG: site-specific DNA-methyltransferase [Candidatus Lokiarchaeota archaeon]|nr:site-specific DNA-methyltransferase [Candidatus Lokiarchaeota archaeon]